MATKLTNPTPAQRQALADNTAFRPYVKTSLASQAAGFYNSNLRISDWNKFVYVQMAMTDGQINGTAISQIVAQVIAWHPAAPAAWFTLQDFSGIDPATLDTAVLTAFQIIAGF